MSEKTQAASGGIGFCGLLTVVFIVLKLTGHVDWSWFWVVSPLLIGPAVVIAVVVIGLTVYGLIYALGGLIGYLNRRDMNQRASLRERVSKGNRVVNSNDIGGPWAKGGR